MQSLKESEFPKLKGTEPYQLKNEELEKEGWDGFP
jgi:hypothetical protein